MRRLIGTREGFTEKSVILRVSFWVGVKAFDKVVFVPKKGIEKEGRGSMEVQKWAAKIVAQQINDSNTWRKVGSELASKLLDEDLKNIRWQEAPNGKPPF